jgi:hypothetical protein
MAIIALSVEPYAASRNFAADLARALGLALVDLRAFELEIAHMTAEGPDAVLDLVPGQLGAGRWSIRANDLVARLSELVLETAMHGNALIVGWSAAAVLRSLPHVATVSLRSSVAHRAITLQRRMLYTHFDSALLDLASDDLSVDHLVARFLMERRSGLDLADLTLNTERVSETMCIDLIKHLTTEPRCVENAATHQMIESRLVALR